MKIDSISVLVFCAVLLVGLLVYAGQPFLLDDFSLLISAANLGGAGADDINILAYAHWDLPPPHSLGAFGPAGEYYAKKAPAPAWLGAALFRLGHIVPWLGRSAMALLLGPLLTAGTAALLYDWARRLGYARATAAASALLFGGASMALVYSRFLLGEPVMMFGLTLAAWAVFKSRSRERGCAAILCGLGLGLAAGGNLALVIFGPAFALYLWRRAGARCVFYMVGVLFVCLALIGLYNYVRFGAPLQTGYHFDTGEGFTTPLWVGLYGLLVSPARGLLWFNPLTWLALPGWWLWRRRAPDVAWFVLALVAGQVLLFSAWWAWAGGISWGPRFLLPAVPFLTVMALPMMARARESRVWFAWTAAVVGFSIIVQLTGALTDLNVYAGELYTLAPRGEHGPHGYPHGWPALTDPALSPIAGQAQTLFERGPVVAWYREGAIDGLALGGLVAALGVVLWAMWRARRTTVLVAVAATLLAANVAVSRTPGPPAHLQELPGALAGHEPDDVLLLLTPELTWPVADLVDRPPAVGLPRSAWVDDSAANKLFDRALADRRRAWLLTYDPPPPSWYEDRLRARGTLVHEALLDGYRLAVYALNGP